VTFISLVLLTADIADCIWWSNLRSEYCWTIVWLVWIAAGDGMMMSQSLRRTVQIF